jgi:plastocyanin
MHSYRRSRARATALALAAALSLGLVAVPPAAAAPVVIRGHAISWSPATVSIVRGGVVRWRSVHLTHNVYAYGTNWTFGAPLPEGTSTRHRFPRRGTYRFRCTLHSTLLNGTCSGMCGSVRVA